MKRIILKLIASLFNKLKSIYFFVQYEEFRKKYDIHSSFRFNGENIIFYGEGSISIDRNSYIGRNSTIEAAKGCTVKIGKNCSISHNFKLYTSSNDPDQNFNDTSLIRNKKKGNVYIGDGVWIGANVFINPNIKIGNNVVIGANSVVTKDIEDNSIVGGVPAKLIRMKSNV